MKDVPSIQRVSLLHPKIREEVRTLIEKAEEKLGQYACVRIVQGLRTFAEQHALFLQRPVVTHADQGQSYHNYGLAIDFAIMYDKDKNGTFETLSWDLVKDMDRDGEADWQEVVEVFVNAGYAWGGSWRSFKDNPHLEKTFNLTVRQLLAKYNAHQLSKYVVL